MNKTREEIDKILTLWEPVLIHIDNEPFTGLSYDVPGWKCKNCGTQYGCMEPPANCWHCEGAS